MDPVRAVVSLADVARELVVGGFAVLQLQATWFLEQTKGGAIERTVAKRVRTKTAYGQDLVARPRRLASMSLYLHGIEPDHHAE